MLLLPVTVLVAAFAAAGTPSHHHPTAVLLPPSTNTGTGIGTSIVEADALHVSSILPTCPRTAAAMTSALQMRMWEAQLHRSHRLEMDQLRRDADEAVAALRDQVDELRRIVAAVVVVAVVLLVLLALLVLLVLPPLLRKRLGWHRHRKATGSRRMAPAKKWSTGQLHVFQRPPPPSPASSTSASTSASTSTPSLLSSATTDSCSSSSPPRRWGSAQSMQSSPSTPRPPYIAIPAAATIEQMARDADARHPHHPLDVLPPPFIPPLDQETDASYMYASCTGAVPRLTPITTKTDSTLKRKARILCRRWKSVLKNARKRGAIRPMRCFFLAAVPVAIVLSSTTFQFACAFTRSTRTWKWDDLAPNPRPAGASRPAGLVVELATMLSVFLAVGCCLSFCASNGNSASSAGHAKAKSSIRRRRSLIRGPCNKSR
jgi:hypothetical protein